jgi:hypothetical protein
MLSYDNSTGWGIKDLPHFEEAREKNGSRNTLQQQSPDVHLQPKMGMAEANQPHETYPTSTPTTSRTVTNRNVGDLYAPPCTIPG